MVCGPEAEGVVGPRVRNIPEGINVYGKVRTTFYAPTKFLCTSCLLSLHVANFVYGFYGGINVYAFMSHKQKFTTCKFSRQEVHKKFWRCINSRLCTGEIKVS